jgi:hypothetical protein
METRRVMGLKGKQGILHHGEVGEEIDNLKCPSQSEIGSPMTLHFGDISRKEVYLAAGRRQLPGNDVE